MKKVLVLGGKLQGVEAAYLMQKAGWHVAVVDKNPHASASLLADEFICTDIMTDKALLQRMQKADLVIPALEKLPVLEYIAKQAKACGARLMFNLPSYRISSSKLASDKLFQQLSVPAPGFWPACGLPVVVKPSGRSGSEGVQKIDTQAQLDEWLDVPEGRKDWVIQEYITGPSYSIEVIAVHGIMKTFQVTELFMDRVHDCKRVVCPSLLSTEQEAEFSKCAAVLAEAVQLHGIMDVEVILHNGKLKVLEIDARIPSQTLTAVYFSTGVIAPKVFADLLENPELGAQSDEAVAEHTAVPGKGVIYEHIQVTDGCLSVNGEHIMGSEGPLQLQQDFFGADEALTNYKPDKKHWVATLIIQAEDRAAVWKKRNQVIENIMKKCDIMSYKDEEPEEELS